jgi:hypothetical protein
MPKDTSHPTTKPSAKGNRKQRSTPTQETKTDLRKEQYNRLFLVGDHVCIIMEEPLATNQTPYTSKYGGTTTLPWPPIYGVIVGKNDQESTADIETFVMIGEIWTRTLKKAPLQGLINTRQADLISRDIALKQIEELQHQLIDIPAQHRKQVIPAVNLSCYGRDTKSVNRERNLSQIDFQIQQHSDDIITSLANRNRIIFGNIQRIVMSVNTDGEAADNETPKLEGIIYLLVQLGNERKLRQPAVLRQAVKETTNVLAEVVHSSRSAARLIDTLSLIAGMIILSPEEVIERYSDSEEGSHDATHRPLRNYIEEVCHPRSMQIEDKIDPRTFDVSAWIKSSDETPKHTDDDPKPPEEGNEEIRDLKETINNLTAENNRLKNQLETELTERVRLSGERIDALRRVSLINATNKLLMKDIERLRHQSTNLDQEELGALKSQLDESKIEINNKRKALVEATTQVKRFKTGYDEAIEDKQKMLELLVEQSDPGFLAYLQNDEVLNLILNKAHQKASGNDEWKSPLSYDDRKPPPSNQDDDRTVDLSRSTEDTEAQVPEYPDASEP